MTIEGWDITKRIQFTIAPDNLSENTDLPFMFRINTDTGIENTNLTYVFDAMVNVDSPSRKILFSQVIDGQERACYSELDTWDSADRRAVFWVKPIQLSATDLNIFYFYYDKNHADSFAYSATAADTAITLFLDKGQGTADSGGVFPLELIKVDNTYKFWYFGLDSVWDIHYCESQDLVNWVNNQLVVPRTHANDISNRFPGSILYEDGTFKMWYSGTDGTYRIFYSESLDGISWANPQLVVDAGESVYSSYYVATCSVIKDGTVYKMWYGGHDSTNYRIMYCESADGLVWYGHQMVVDLSDSPVVGTSHIRPSKVIYTEGTYFMWAEAFDGTGWRLLHATSTNGTYWSDFEVFCSLGTQGVYDVEQLAFMTVLEEDEVHKLIYGANDGTYWRILKADSVIYTAPATASQAVWEDKFSCVHHFNPEFGYKDSTPSNINIDTFNNTTSGINQFGSHTLIYAEQDSYVLLSDNTIFNDGNAFGATVFINSTDGNTVLSKGSMLSLYYTELTNPDPSDDFVGLDGSFPDANRWTAYDSNGSITLFDNRLRLESNSTESDWRSVNLYSEFKLAGDFDIQFEWYAPWAHDSDHYTVLRTYGDGWRMLLGPRNYYDPYNIYFSYVEPGGVQTDDSHATGWPEGFIRITRTGTTGRLYYKHYLTDDWILRGTVTTGSDDATVLIHHQKRYQEEEYFVTYINDFTVNSGTVVWPYPNSNNNNLSFKVEDSDQTYYIEQSNEGHRGEWTLLSCGKNDEGGANTVLSVDAEYGLAKNTDTLLTNTNYLSIGSSGFSVQGELSEFLCTYNALDKASLDFMRAGLNDELIKISRYYVQGHTTKYGLPVSRPLVVYDKTTGTFRGSTVSASVDGYYFIYLPTADECFIVGLDGDLYNHIISGKITPSHM